MAGYVKAVNGQCGTCKWALRFERGPSSPLGPEEGICCTSEAHVRCCFEQAGYDFDCDSFKENGYTLCLRLEDSAEEGYVCPHWQPKEKVYGAICKGR
jgi:hypothetical protein